MLFGFSPDSDALIVHCSGLCAIGLSRCVLLFPAAAVAATCATHTHTHTHTHIVRYVS
jgi:hypothetical protein